MQRFLLILGALILLVGLCWPWVSKLPVGRLPGDLVIDRPSLKVFLPITSALLVSILISLLFWLFRR